MRRLWLQVRWHGGLGCLCGRADVRAGFSIAFAVSGTVAVVSILKSPTVGGGTLAGSGRGTAASIASSAALARGVVDWAASAEVADTVRKVAATAISTRSNPARFVEQSRIVTPPWANCPGMEQSLGIVRHGLRGKRRLDRFLSRTPARHGSNADDTYAPLMQPAPCGTTHDKLTSNYPFAFGLHGFATLPAFCLSPPSHGSKASERRMSLVCHDLCHAGAIITHRPPAQFASPSAGSLAAASSSLR